MNYIKYVLSKDNTKLYTKINEVEKAKSKYYHCPRIS